MEGCRGENFFGDLREGCARRVAIRRGAALPVDDPVEPGGEEDRRVPEAEAAAAEDRHGEHVPVEAPAGLSFSFSF